ncbi:MAG: exosome complex protein Rrp42 [Candidatus Verstraetearchaeota archaeon]|nr:exosome complex protein Rrp42 [Candidatus Verstraetearchaeota archaeon]
MTNQIIPSVKRKQIIELAESGKRTDGRSLTDMRPVEIQTNVIEKAEGSATVRLGDTYVIAGVKFAIGDPFPDIPNDGVMSVSAEFVPLASSEFETGPPDENAIELARVVDRGLRESKLLDTSKLCIIPGKKVWIAWVDIFILDHRGNLMDAAALAGLSALLTSKMPKAEVSGEEVKVTEEFVPVPLRAIPVNVTMAKIGDKLFVDPSLEEEEVMDCRLSVAFAEDDQKQEKICAMQKGGSGTLTPEELLRAVEIAKVKSQELRKHLPSGGK